MASEEREGLIDQIVECVAEGRGFSSRVSLEGQGICFTTTSAAKAAIRSKVDDGVYVRRVAEYVADPKNDIRDSAINYYNLVVVLSDAADDDYSAALVARRGLELHPADIDLLAVTLSSTSACGDYVYCDDLLKSIARIDRSYWSERLFSAVLRYYTRRVGDPDCSDAKQRALDCAKDFRARFPFSDTAVQLQAQLFIDLGLVDEAEEVLRATIFGGTGPDVNSRKVISAPRCCLLYIDKILSEQGDQAAYEEISRVARKGVQYTAEEQPSALIGYFLYRDAEAMDALMCSENGSNTFKNEARVREILSTYQCAYRLLPNESYRHTIWERYVILTARSGITDMPLVDASAAGGRAVERG